MAAALTPSPTVLKLNTFVSTYLTRVPARQKILFIHNLYIMVKAGLSIVDGLRILGEQIENKKLKQVVVEIKQQVERGRQLSEALTDYPRVFPAIYVSMIAAGEAGGKLEEALWQVSTQMRKSHELVARIRGALIYPAVILAAMVGIGIEMVFFVLPKVISLFADAQAELPLPTRILIALVTFIQHYGIFLIAAVVALIAFSVYLVRRPQIRRRVHAANLRLPTAGAVIKKINLARFTMTLSSLLQSTIPIIEAVRIAAQVSSNLSYRESLLAASEQLKKGQTLSETLAPYAALFPPMTVQMILVGEQSGQVEHMLAELADYYTNEVDATMKNFSTIIEPALILVLGLAVAGVAVSVIMPMYSLAQNF